MIVRVRKTSPMRIFENAFIHAINGKAIQECVIPDRANEDSASLGKLRSISDSRFRKHFEQLIDMNVMSVIAGTTLNKINCIQSHYLHLASQSMEAFLSGNHSRPSSLQH